MRLNNDGDASVFSLFTGRSSVGPGLDVEIEVTPLSPSLYAGRLITTGEEVDAEGDRVMESLGVVFASADENNDGAMDCGKKEGKREGMSDTTCEDEKRSIANPD
ncbi:hypothetical protein EYR40_006215 [Pleurotus pulmonarius]|nr:hypothetical protein EYR40_006215 [Pleurotus pulmonarius]